jgi:Zinc carboxypeptidase
LPLRVTAEQINKTNRELIMRKTILLLVLTLLISLFSPCLFSRDFQFMPGAEYDPAIPTLKEIVGHSNGEKITSVADAVKYMEALDKASSKMQLFPYAESWEGRTLYYVVISSDENMGRLDAIKSNIQKLAFPVKGDEESLVDTLPAVAWLACGVHGSEASGPEAALLTIYHLLASRNNQMVNGILDNCITIIDPIQNPDGRARFINYFNQRVGRWPDADPQAAEHNESWPGGRYNHYLFDMNRDWFGMTQPETQGRTKLYQEWFPLVMADLHEMGGDSTYYFAPPAIPHNPEITKDQIGWLTKMGENNARWFDKMQFDYFTREVFDSFYPGYGEGWPMFQGTIGMTYEQGSVRGLVRDRSDNTTIIYRESVQHQFIASIATLESASNNRKELVSHFYNYRKNAAEGNFPREVKEIIIAEGPDPSRTLKLVNSLGAQGIKVLKATADFSNAKARDYYTDEFTSMEFPAGSYIIPLNQPAGHLAATLLMRHTPQSEEFIEIQKKRREKGLRDQIYDLTAWSLPLLFDVKAWETGAASDAKSTTLDELQVREGQVIGGKASLAYLVPWGEHSSAKLLAELFRRDIRVFASDLPFTILDREFPAGSLIVKTKNNPDDLYQQISEAASNAEASVYATGSSWVKSGPNFGSNNVRYLERPRIALLYDLPTSPTPTGAARFILEQQYGYPVTLLQGMNLTRTDLSGYNVLILPPSRGIMENIGNMGINKIKDWVRNGGTLVALGSSTEFLTDEKVGLLATKAEFKEDPGKKNSDKPKVSKTKPDNIPGAILRVKLDNTHWLAFGYGEGSQIIVDSNRIYTPLNANTGRNVGLYCADPEKLMVSGFAWEETLKQFAGKACLIWQPSGSGNVVAFSEDPNFRAFQDGTNLLFLNAVFFGPGQ